MAIASPARTAGQARPSLLIITPVYDGNLPIPYLNALFGTHGELQARGGRCRWLTKAGDSLLPMARNQLAAQALAVPTWTYLLLVDADISWRPEDVPRLMARNLPFVAGLYAHKTEGKAGVKFECVPLPDQRPDPQTDLLEVDCVGAGFMLPKREVFQRLIAAYPESRFSRTLGAYDVEQATLPWLHDFFPLGFQDGVYTGEDFAFCRRWRASGGQVWADLTVRLNHYGIYAYTGGPMSLFEPTEERTA